MRRHYSWFLLLTLPWCGMPLYGQPILDKSEADITKASKALRGLLYERLELRRELEEIEANVARLQRREQDLTQLINLQRELDEVERQIELATANSDEASLARLVKRADSLEFNIETARTIADLGEELSEYQSLVFSLQEEDTEQLAEPVIELVDQLKAFRDLQPKLLEAFLDHREETTDELEQRADELEAGIDRGREHVELIWELLEAYEEDELDAVQEIREQLKRLSSHESAPAADDQGFADPLRQPIPITAEGLASVADLNFDSDIVPLLKTHCFACHSDDSESGELNLERMVSESPIVVNRNKWVNVLEQLKNRVMPPEGEAQPSEADRTRLLLSLHHSIHDFDYSNIRHPGYEPTRRLSHDEYDNTIRDLFGIDLRPTERFPADMTGSSGFDNSANTLFMQPLLMERYLGAADFVIATALPDQAETAEQRRAYALVFGGHSPNEAVDEASAARSIVERFLTRAYRRPPTSRECDRAMEQFRAARGQGLNFQQAVKTFLRTSLVSPNFLLKVETHRETTEEYPVTSWEMASRLSYFLWASMPDAELFELAESGELNDPLVRRAQVDRMLADPNTETLGSEFAAQWLGSRHLGTRMRMDPIDNPWCTDSLMKAMRDETAMFFHALVRQNEPIPRLIDADFTYLNAELAKHYRIRGVRGEQMRRVALTDNQRGGIFGHGSLLAITSFPYRTSPVVRGKWILSDVLGTPPPPPPPNVSELPEEIEENERLTFREKLELHRQSPNCYACHSQMDPLGFSLEGYDFFGRERGRGRGRGKPDVRGRLPNGTEFTGLAGLKKVVVEQRLDDLCKQITRKMLSYALGRQLEYYDEPAVRKIVACLADDHFRLQTLIHEVVDSYPFRFKQAAEESQTTR